MTAIDAVYLDLIKEPLENAIHVSRADDPSWDGVFYENIYDQIVQSLWDASDYIIADLTGSNANVNYELGIAHTLNKRTYKSRCKSLDLMFDIKSQNVIPYIVEGDQPSGLSRSC